MKNVLPILLLLISNSAIAETLPDLICPRMTLGAPTADQSKIVGSTVAIWITDRHQRPMTALVEGLDIYPEGTQLRMNFQDVFGKGKNPDGIVLHVEPGKGDGTLQDICGRDSNVMIHDQKKDQIYCGECSVNPGFGLKKIGRGPSSVPFISEPLDECSSSAFDVVVDEISRRHPGVAGRCQVDSKDRWRVLILESLPPKTLVEGFVACYPSTYWKFSVSLDSSCQKVRSLKVERD